MNKTSDLSLYENPFNINNFIFSTPVTIRHIILQKINFEKIELKYKSDGKWYMKAHINSNGNERWFIIDKDWVENYLNNLPSDVFLEEMI